MTSRGATPRPSLDHVWIAAVFAILLLRPLLTPVQPFDYWWHVATGRFILEHGSIPLVDSYSYTQPGAPFYNQSWLAQLFMYGLHQLGGLPLVIIFQAVLIALTYGLLVRLLYLRTGRLRLSVVVLLIAAIPLSFDNWSVRPQSYALLLFAATLTILTEYRLGLARRLWLLPLLMVLWVNIHGSFVLGLALIGITFISMAISTVQISRGNDRRQQTPDDEKAVSPVVGGRRSAVELRPLLIWGVLTGLAILINPRGFEVVGYVRNLLGSNQVTQLVTEWAPPTIRDFGGLYFFVFLIGMLLAAAYARRPPEPADLLLLLPFTWLALSAVRNVVWFGLVATPLLAVTLAALFPPPKRAPAQGAAVPNIVILGILALLVASALPWVKPAIFPPSVGALVEADTPVDAVAFLRAQPERPERLFHALSYGSYLIWAAPEQKVFIDPRIELYPFAQWVDYTDLSGGSDAQMLLDRYQIDGALLSQADQRRLIAVLRADPDWVVRYQDEQTVYFTKR